MQFPFQESKSALEQALNLSPALLHVYTGLGVFLLLSLLRGSWRAMKPLAGVILAACAGELWDLCEDIRRLGYWRWADSIRDVAATVTLPLLIHAAAHGWSRLLSAADRKTQLKPLR